MRLLFTSDLHGRAALYEQLWHVAPAYDAVILGGDLLPNPLRRSPKPQRQALREILRQITAFRRAHPNTDFYAILGNDDWGDNQDLLEQNEDVHALHGRVLSLPNGWSLLGYSSVNITPFGMKDWEKWDLEPGETGTFRRSGYRSRDGQLHEFTFTEAYTDTIAKDLDEIGSRVNDFSRTLCVMHAPLHDTPLDVAYPYRHVGSRAIRHFIETHQPFLTLHGHIHESPHRTGQWSTLLERTLSINPGQGEPWHYVSVMLEPLQVEHSVYGPLATAG